MASKTPDQTKDATLSTLISVKGIGPALAKKIWDAFGESAVQRLVDDPTEAALSVSGLSKATAIRAGEILRTTGPAEQVHRALNYIENLDEVQNRILRDWTVLFHQRLRVEEVLNKYRDDLLQYPLVTGIHVGLRRTPDQKIVDPLEYCIRVHVSKKAASDGSDVDKLLPTAIEGVRINVLERTYQTTAGGIIRGGLAIAAKTTPAVQGTLGGLVFCGGRTLYITNNHVAGDFPSEILQPPIDNNAIIGTVVNQRRDEFLDCSIIQPLGGREAVPEIIGLSPASNFEFGKLTKVDATLGTRAFKIGAKKSSLDLIGKVTDIDFSVDVIDRVTGKIWPMKRQILVDSISDEVIIEGGDSGSLLLVKAPGNNQYRVVGLVNAEANGGKTIVASHFEDVANRFGVTVS